MLPPRFVVLVTLIALWWPGRLSGIFDGAPFDTGADAVVLGLLLPVLLCLIPAIARDRRTRIVVVALLAWKVFSSVALVQDGLCVAVEAPGRAGLIKNWDARTRWWSTTPACSAIADRPFLEERQFPIWLPFSFPASSDSQAPPTAPDPDRFVAKLHLAGTIVVEQEGVLRLVTAPSVDARMTIDGRELNGGETLPAGAHELAIDATLRDSNWAMTPLWNDGDLFRAVMVTASPPSAADRLTRPWGKWISFALVAALLALALRHALAEVQRWQIAAWIAATTTAGALLPVLIGERWWHFALLGLLGACWVRVPDDLRNIRGAFFLLAPAWLAINVVDTFNDQGFGRLDFIAPGNDWWAFQLYSYRIYMEGYWLEGGERAFWYQPFYRWIAGALHLLFGHSQVGENYWDAIGVLVMALFSFEVVRMIRGFRWGCAAAALVLVAFVSGPGYIFIGRGLSEISSAAFIYLAALAVIRARDHRSVALLVAGGVLAVLGTWTRLNNLPMAVAVVIFAWPLTEPAAVLWKPRNWFTNAWPAALMLVPAVIAAGMSLFALRTWYYTGHFSMFYGTQAEMLRIWKAGMPLGEVARQMIDSLAMVVTTMDPPGYKNGALPIIAGFVVSVAAISGAGWLGRLPLALVGFTLAAFSGALVARGTAYSGRFSVHVIGVAIATLIVAIAAIADAYRFKRGTYLVKP